MEKAKTTPDKSKKDIDIVEFIVNKLPFEIQEDAWEVLKDLSKYSYKGKPPFEFFIQMLIKRLIRKNLKGEQTILQNGK